MKLTYSVLLFGSHPDEENDDCWTGDDFATREEAERVLADPWRHFDAGYFRADTAYLVLDGPDVSQTIQNPGFRPSRRDDSDWRRESAMQAGMAFGCVGYNDAMGF